MAACKMACRHYSAYKFGILQIIFPMLNGTVFRRKILIRRNFDER